MKGKQETIREPFRPNRLLSGDIYFLISIVVLISLTHTILFVYLKEFQSGSVRNFVMSVESPLGPLLYLRVWHDNSGQKGKASWYLNMINAMDLQTGEK